MNNLSKPQQNRSFTLLECKIQAKVLLKQLYASDVDIAMPAYKRFIDSLLINHELLVQQNATLADIKAIAKLKHALTIITNEYGFNSWLNLKTYFDKTKHTQFIMTSAFLNQWFADYKTAKTYLKSHPHDFLLPYKNQFFICEISYIEFLGFDLNNSDWQLISHNWVEPSDLLAWERLNTIYLKIKGAHHG